MKFAFVQNPLTQIPFFAWIYNSFIISHVLEWLKVHQIKSGIRVNFDQCGYVVVFLPVSVTLTWNQSSDRRSKPGSSVGNWKFSFSGFNIAAEAIPLVPVNVLTWKIVALYWPFPFLEENLKECKYHNKFGMTPWVYTSFFIIQLFIISCITFHLWKSLDCVFFKIKCTETF